MNGYKGKKATKTALLLALCLVFSFVLSVSAFAADRSAVGSRPYTSDANRDSTNRHFTGKTNRGSVTDSVTDSIPNGQNGSVGNGANGNNNSFSGNGGGVVTDDTTTRNDMYGGVVGDTHKPIEDVIPGDDEIDGDTRDEVHGSDRYDESVMGEEEGEVLGVADADGGVVGIVIAILIAVAVIVLIIALIPKSTSSM